LSLIEWDKRGMREQRYKLDVVCLCVCVRVCGLTNLTSGNTKGLMGPSMAWWDW